MSQSTNTESDQPKQPDLFSAVSDFASQAFKGLESHEKLFFSVAIIFAFLALSATLRLESDQLYTITLILIVALVVSLFFVLAKAVKANQETLNKRIVKNSLSNTKASLDETLEVLMGKREFLQNTLSSLKTIGQEFEEVEPITESSLDAADSVRRNVANLIFKVNEELRKINTFLSHYQDYQKIQETPKEIDELTWKRASMR